VEENMLSKKMKAINEKMGSDYEELINRLESLMGNFNGMGIQSIGDTNNMLAKSKEALERVDTDFSDMSSNRKAQITDLYNSLLDTTNGCYLYHKFSIEMIQLLLSYSQYIGRSSVHGVLHGNQPSTDEFKGMFDEAINLLYKLLGEPK
jgi:hypothetical protein